MIDTEITVTVEQAPVFIVGAVEQGPIGLTGDTGATGAPGNIYLDGGAADSIYGPIEPIDGGNATSF